MDSSKKRRALLVARENLNRHTGKKKKKRKRKKKGLRERKVKITKAVENDGRMCKNLNKQNGALKSDCFGISESWDFVDCIPLSFRIVWFCLLGEEAFFGFFVRFFATWRVGCSFFAFYFSLVGGNEEIKNRKNK